MKPQKKDEERPEEEEATEKLKRFTTQKRARGLSLFEEALLVFKAQDSNVEWYTKVETAIRNTIQCYCVICSFGISPPNEYSGLNSFRIDWFDLLDVQESSPAPQFESLNSVVLSLLYGPTLTSIQDYWKKPSCWQIDVFDF